MKSRFELVKMAGLLLALLLTGAQPVMAAGQHQTTNREFTRTITKDFPLSSAGTLRISNRYGKVDVNTWDRERVKITVTIVVEARNESAAESVFDRIDILFDNGADYVSATTEISSSSGSWFNWSWGGSDGSFRINYEVFMPFSAKLELTNKYGNAYIKPMGGRLDADIKYGDLQIEELRQPLDALVGYGNCSIIRCEDARLQINYGKLTLERANDVDLTSKYSRLHIARADELKANSSYDRLDLGQLREADLSCRYGDVRIEEVRRIDAEGRYTDFRIERLRDRGSFNTQYGAVTIERLERGFANLDLQGRYTHFKIGVTPGTNYVLDADTRYAGLTYPASLKLTEEDSRGSAKKVKGHAGALGSRSVIKARIDYGGLKIME